MCTTQCWSKTKKEIIWTPSKNTIGIEKMFSNTFLGRVSLAIFEHFNRMERKKKICLLETSRTRNICSDRRMESNRKHKKLFGIKSQIHYHLRTLKAMQQAKTFCGCFKSGYSIRYRVSFDWCYRDVHKSQQQNKNRHISKFERQRAQIIILNCRKIDIIASIVHLLVL